MKVIYSIVFLLGISVSGRGQMPDTLGRKQPAVSPIPIEALLLGKAINYQLIVNKAFSPENRFGFFGVVNLLNTYRNESSKNEFMVLSTVSYKVFKEVSLNAGMWTNNMIGVRPTIAVNYTRVGRDFLLVYVPRIDLTENHNAENVLIAELFPKIAGHWALYDRLQALYNYNLKGKVHDRSYVYLRAGVSYNKIRFGAGMNLDYYGPHYERQLNFGLFVGSLLF